MRQIRFSLIFIFYFPPSLPPRFPHETLCARARACTCVVRTSIFTFFIFARHCASVAAYAFNRECLPPCACACACACTCSCMCMCMCVCACQRCAWVMRQGHISPGPGALQALASLPLSSLGKTMTGLHIDWPGVAWQSSSSSKLAHRWL